MDLMLLILSLAVGLGTMVSVSEQRPVYDSQVEVEHGTPVELTARNWGNMYGGRQNNFGGRSRFQNMDPYQQAYLQGKWAAKMKQLQRKQARMNAVNGGSFNRFNGGNGFNNFNGGEYK